MKAVLVALGISGFLVLAMVAPNLIGVLGKQFGIKRHFKANTRRAIYALEKRGLVGISQRNGETVVEVTKEGKRKLIIYKLEEMKVKPQKKWDKKWRIVIFDIPEKYNTARLIFRNKLKEIGFAMIQKSVWVCPYPCEKEIAFLKEVYEIYPFVNLITAEKIDFESRLNKVFHAH